MRAKKLPVAHYSQTRIACLPLSTARPRKTHALPIPQMPRTKQIIIFFSPPNDIRDPCLQTNSSHHYHHHHRSQLFIVHSLQHVVAFLRTYLLLPTMVSTASALSHTTTKQNHLRHLACISLTVRTFSHTLHGGDSNVFVYILRPTRPADDDGDLTGHSHSPFVLVLIGHSHFARMLRALCVPATHSFSHQLSQTLPLLFVRRIPFPQYPNPKRCK